jgi:UDP-N-acetylglucosamine 2-epimerase (non-hydrolysing)
MEKHSKIAIVIGTKAELIKTFPLMLELQRQKKDYWFISTGQHPLSQISSELEVKKPDFVLSEEPKSSTKFWSKINSSSILWSFKMIFRIKNILKKLKPKYVIYHGDTMSTATAAIGSSNLFNKKKSWKNVHLEAGLRSGNLFEPFPEEISRQISDRFSDILLAVSDLTKNNLKKYKNKKVVKTGNTIVDSALIMYNKVKNKYKKPQEEFALINTHRHEHLKSKERMKKIVDIISQVKIKGIWPLHDNTRRYLEKYDLMREIKKMKNIEITPLKNYKEFIFLVANCKYLIMDGGSIQEESLIFKKPCLILRNFTERQEGLSTGINFLSKLDVDYSKKIIEQIENNKLTIKNFKNPYGEKGVSKKIVDVVLR